MDITCNILSKAEFEQALAIRLTVFVDEQKVPLEEERDTYDDTAIHFGAFVGDLMVATGRLIIDGDKGKIGRMAVLKAYRGSGIGLALLGEIVRHCQAINLTQAYLSSQTHAIPFYKKAGFITEGEIYQDAGIPHKTMRKSL